MDKIISDKIILRANLTKCHFVGYITYWLKYHSNFERNILVSDFFLFSSTNTVQYMFAWNWCPVRFLG